MDRGMTGTMLQEVAKPVNRPVHLLEVEFPAATVRMTDAAVQIAWNGQTYLPTHFLAFSEVEETAELAVTRCGVTLSGVDQSIIALLLQDDYFNRPARIYKAFITESLTVIVDPFVLVEGRMDKPVITTNPDDGLCNASVDIVSRFSAFERGTGRHTNNEEQQKFFPGDKGFEYVTDGEDKVVVWGRVRAPPTAEQQAIMRAFRHK